MSTQWSMDPDPRWRDFTAEDRAQADAYLAEVEVARAEVARRLLEIHQRHTPDLWVLYGQATRPAREPRYYWSNPGYGERSVKYARVLVTAALIFGIVAFIDWQAAIGGFLACTTVVGTVWALDCLSGVHRMTRRR